MVLELSHSLSKLFEYLLCYNYYSRYWRYNNKQNGQFLLSGAYNLKVGSVVRIIACQLEITAEKKSDIGHDEKGTLYVGKLGTDF